jgi:hypothetical protein
MRRDQVTSTFDDTKVTMNIFKNFEVDPNLSNMIDILQIFFFILVNETSHLSREIKFTETFREFNQKSTSNHL